MFHSPPRTGIRVAFLVVSGADSQSDFGIDLSKIRRKLRFRGAYPVEIEFQRSGAFDTRDMVPGVVVAERFGFGSDCSCRTVVIQVGHAILGVLDDGQSVPFSKIPSVTVYQYLSVPSGVALVGLEPSGESSFVTHVQRADFANGHVSAVRHDDRSSELSASANGHVRTAEGTAVIVPTPVERRIARRLVKVPVSDDAASAESGFQGVSRS